MSQTYHEHQRPAPSSAFLSGFASYAFNGALIMGILFALTVTAGAILPASAGIVSVTTLPFLASATIATLATGLFGGIMSAKRALFDAPQSPATERMAVVPIAGASLAPMIAPALDAAPEQGQTASWTAKTGRSGDHESRIQEIISNGALSDQQRAAAILAARQEETAADVSANRR